ncbi:uncharacterized protein LOC123214359 [Mangifera indica]|uniref:uncharacterized protein LOC123214359 n=1 Tax=Mangifera indica TaxID=29780 RepID=UPI001CFABA93|nr:uncharacterized protein LOC123214359 [Mangifera indica]
MRIRKRQVPLPLSSLSPVPVVSDPHFNRSPPVVQLHYPHHNRGQEHDRKSYGFSQRSDHPNQPIGTSNNALDDGDLSVAQTHKKIDCLILMKDKDFEGGKSLEQVRDEDEDEEKSSNDSRNKSILDAEMVVNGVVVSSHLSSSHQVVGRWCEGEKAFPLKKRRASFERRGNEETSVILDDEKDNNIHKKMKTKIMKTKMNKKFGLDSHLNQQEDSKETTAAKDSLNVVDDNNNSNNNNNSSTATSASKKRARGGALMEGSRCSRVNGRGWRCCQQTLVGYSLCEHHLGKGRLRSMTSVRSRSLGNSKNNENTLISSSSNAAASSNSTPTVTAASISSFMEETKNPSAANELLEEGDDEEKRPLMMTTKKRAKLGTVKARSISSLLGQTNNEQVTVGENNR